MIRYKSAVSRINEKGALLVFPVNNRKEPPSLWSEFYPRIKMRWEWDESGDDKVSDLWYLMKKLSASREVVYSKWYQGRATFFSREVFTALLKLRSEAPLSRTASEILEVLENDSPLSTKQLKKITELQGKDNEKFYNRAMKELFSGFHIVAFGEVDDGAFPSLAVGATKLLFEDLWLAAEEMSREKAFEILKLRWFEGSAFRLYFSKSMFRNGIKNGIRSGALT